MGIISGFRLLGRLGIETTNNQLINGETTRTNGEDGGGGSKVKAEKLQQVDIETGGDHCVVDRNCDRSKDCKSTESSEQSCDQKPTTSDLRESCDVGENNGEGKVQRTHEGICEIFNIGELLVTVMNQKRAGEYSKHKQAHIGEQWLGEDRSEHCNEGKFRKCNDMSREPVSSADALPIFKQKYPGKDQLRPTPSRGNRQYAYFYVSCLT